MRLPGARGRSARWVAAMLAIASGAVACDAGGDGAPSPSVAITLPTATPTTPPSPTPTLAAGACLGDPPAYAAPDSARPVVTLSFRIAPNHSSVVGHERVVFTPDLPVRELVFRLWVNSPRPARAGGAQRVTAVRGPGLGRFRVERAGGGAGTLGTLLRVPLTRPVAAGIPITADIDFTVQLPSGANDRFGHSGSTAWFGSAFPLLAWERGRGWATQPATAQFAEATSSEVFRLRELSVETNATDSVLATGSLGARTPADAARRRRWTFAAAAVRDVMVAAGPFRMATARFAGAPVTVGVAPGLADDPARIAQLAVAALAVHTSRFGEYADVELDIAVVPDIQGGIEYPGAILLGTRQLDATLTHEVAHQWFYGLVGNNQGRDPWLDESFATYAEALHRGTGGRYRATPIAPSGRNRVGRPMTYWERLGRTYFRAVYLQGATMLIDARAAAGPAAFDRAIRCYVARNAYRVARPADLARALAGLPAARAVLVRAGALPAGS